MALAASLAGVPQALGSALEPEHRCACPAREHACSCPRCAAAKARRAAADAKRPCHGPAASATAPAPRPPCHRGPSPGPAAEEDAPQPSPDAPCLSSSCGGAGAVAVQPGGVDPFVVRQHRVAVPRGRTEGFAPVASLTPVDPSAPEPPPPRA